MRRHYSVSGKGVIVRSGPELESPVVATLARGARVCGATESLLVGTKRRLRVDGPWGTGWCAARLLEAGALAEGAAALLAAALRLPPMPEAYPCELHVARPVTERRSVATVAMG